MPHPLALSTMWMQLRYSRLTPFVEAVLALGISAVELSHVVTPEQIAKLDPDFYPAVRVLHHPCPNPGNVSDLTDIDPVRHMAAITALQSTIEWAAKVGARQVVLHLGRVDVDTRWENALRARHLQQQSDDELRRHVLALRESQVAPHLAQARRALDVVIPFAEQVGVQLALENGEWLFNVPSLSELEMLLGEYGDTLGYWVDTGHATILERLGIETLAGWLTLAPPRLLGLHYHDVHGLRDHLIPGHGTLAWEQIAPLIPPHALPTGEFDWYYTADEIRAGVEKLRGMGLVN